MAKFDVLIVSDQQGKVTMCDDCGSSWRDWALDDVVDFSERVDPGSEVPVGQCPDKDCAALCYYV